MKKIYISAAVLLAVAITEGCIKQRVAESSAAKHISVRKAL
ncbi:MULTISPECIES: hypothetical protein [unclassified Mucilaginibacter]|nr:MULTISPECIES: hypothetical protein [unclassified Mucilaginibacter]MEB0260490.1 hypothetical protein [Mucilaginibacter sp. 10I4]MEB0280072.1 hypothetical protein [Mucilaginibacter sp. 10B2]MEB0302770.1 hypothetical protein [Mucilaginibacter sp. 5C4]WPX23587.1 hypothetical protein RHM67_20140 [Mucilaginibacter sp. 5C4]